MSRHWEMDTSPPRRYQRSLETTKRSPSRPGSARRRDRRRSSPGAHRAGNWRASPSSHAARPSAPARVPRPAWSPRPSSPEQGRAHAPREQVPVHPADEGHRQRLPARARQRSLEGAFERRRRAWTGHWRRAGLAPGGNVDAHLPSARARTGAGPGRLSGPRPAAEGRQGGGTSSRATSPGRAERGVASGPPAGAGGDDFLWPAAPGRPAGERGGGAGAKARGGPPAGLRRRLPPRARRP
jgi:hypothetical protein